MAYLAVTEYCLVAGRLWRNGIGGERDRRRIGTFKVSKTQVSTNRGSG